MRVSSRPDLQLSVIRVEVPGMTKDELCYSLSRFVTDVKKQNGEDNPGSTLHELIFSWHWMWITAKCLSFLTTTIWIFGSAQKHFTVWFWIWIWILCRSHAWTALRFDCMGIKTRQAEMISNEEDYSLWLRGDLGGNSPEKLLDTVIYL